MSDAIEKFKSILLSNYEENMKHPFAKRDLCSPSTNAQLALGCLCDTFLGEGWYVAMPEGVEQVNTAIVFNILYKHNRKFRKWHKKTSIELRKREKRNVLE